MTRRDFQQMADCIRSLPLADARRVFIAHHFADSFAVSHPHFNRAKFYKACGVPPPAEESDAPQA